MSNQSLPAVADDVINDVVASSAKDIEWLLDVLMPDGRPFGMEPLTEAEQIERYMKAGLHDNMEAALAFIREKAAQIAALLQRFGVPSEQAASAHPYDIAIVASLTWSAEMEKKLGKRVLKVAQSVSGPIPSIPEMPTEMTDAGSRTA